MSERDPRVDPRPGDVVGHRILGKLEVTQVVFDAVDYRFAESKDKGVRFRSSLDTWRWWCRGAEVVAAAVAVSTDDNKGSR